MGLWALDQCAEYRETSVRFDNTNSHNTIYPNISIQFPWPNTSMQASLFGSYSVQMFWCTVHKIYISTMQRRCLAVISHNRVFRISKVHNESTTLFPRLSREQWPMRSIFCPKTSMVISDTTSWEENLKQIPKSTHKTEEISYFKRSISWDVLVNLLPNIRISKMHRSKIMAMPFQKY